MDGGITVKVGVPVVSGQDWGTHTEMWRKEQNEREKTEMDKTPEVKAAAYLSAVSVMCKQRPFWAARHTIALFAMQ